MFFIFLEIGLYFEKRCRGVNISWTVANNSLEGSGGERESGRNRRSKTAAND